MSIVPLMFNFLLFLQAAYSSPQGRGKLILLIIAVLSLERKVNQIKKPDMYLCFFPLLVGFPPVEKQETTYRAFARMLIGKPNATIEKKCKNKETSVFSFYRNSVVIKK